MLGAKDQVAKQADTAPTQFRAQEKSALGTSVAQAQAAAKTGAMTMLGATTTPCSSRR